MRASFQLGIPAPVVRNHPPDQISLPELEGKFLSGSLGPASSTPCVTKWHSTGSTIPCLTFVDRMSDFSTVALGVQELRVTKRIQFGRKFNEGNAVTTEGS